MSSNPEILKLQEDNYIAYYKNEGKENKPGVVFLGGFKSDMTGTKATSLEKFCKEKDYSFIRFDYLGHGHSSGKFTDGTIGKWLGNVLDVLDKLTTGPQILIGSSMGGWLMLLAALARPERIVALIGVASAPDFTENLIWDAMDATAKAELQKNGVYSLNSEYGEEPYPISYELITEGRKHLLLDKKIDINCPVRLIHGLLDKDVPHELSIKLSQQLTSENLCVNLIAEGDHRMSKPEDIELLCENLEELMNYY
jgi:pimeloyl-ACP methyl ester carboxylesterase